MGRMLWQAQNGPQMVTEAGHGLRLSVTPTEAPDSIRFVVEEAESDGHVPHPVAWTLG